MSPTGIYIRTREHNEKIGKALMRNQNSLGHCHSEEHKRKTSESLKGRYMGKDSSQWQGVISLSEYPLEFSDWLKNSIRERDNNTCQLCCKKQGKRKQE